MIAVGCDHGGFALKQEVLAYLEKKGYEYQDFGTYDTESCDYPVYGEKVARAVASGACEKGLLFCGTGIGISLAANRVKGIRAVVCSEPYSAEMSRRHNNANILCLGGRVVDPALAEKIVDVWLHTEFEGGRHARRVEMLDDIAPESK
ncbi:MAG: ribose 5-phosphate isomerase B [Oscillospiraceae bacterium]|nr:ribose 5-phosphate isomerase B [Oscillospiraceae bacterium]